MTDTKVKDESSLKDTVQNLPGSAKAGLFISIFGLGIKLAVENEKLVSGVSSCQAFDFGAWIVGIISIVIGLVTVVEARTADRRALVLGIGLVIITLGVVNLMRAYQVILPLC